MQFLWWESEVMSMTLLMKVSKIVRSEGVTPKEPAIRLKKGFLFSAKIGNKWPFAYLSNREMESLLFSGNLIWSKRDWMSSSLKVMFQWLSLFLMSSTVIVSGPQSYKMSSRKIPYAFESLVMMLIVIIEVSLMAKWPSSLPSVSTLIDSIKSS